MIRIKKTHRIRIVSIVFTLYILAGFVWWVLLLSKKTAEYHSLQIELLENKSLNEKAKQLEIDKIENNLSRKKMMIWGEASVFGIILLILLWRVYLSYRNTLRVSKHQTNFLLAITHEFKTPIASISLILETLLKRKLNDEQKEKLSNDAIRETKRLNSMVNNLLLSARLDSKYSPYPEYLDLCKICKTIITEYQYKYPQANFSIQCNSDLPKAFVDKEGVTAVIYNLLGNALKYCEQEPVIDIHITREKNALQLKIADNGIGIPDREKKNVFKRFYRSGNESTRKTKGTGLGLFIVREVIKVHKGDIRIEDNSPVGTVFIITLPID